MTAVQPPGRFGALDSTAIASGSSTRSRAATAAGSTAASSCCRRGVDRYIDGDDTVWEQEPLRTLAREGQLACYRHEGFWQAMDTLRDHNQLERAVALRRGAVADLVLTA